MTEPGGLVVFDCDGVLVDTERISAVVGAQVLTNLGWHLTPQEVLDRFLGCSDAYYREQVERRVGPLPDGFEAATEPLYDAAFARELAPVPGVVPVLDALQADGVAICVASNSSHDKMRRTLGVTGLLDRFAGRLFSSQDVAHGKPAPDVYLHAASSMGVKPSRCVVVEDSARGVEAARAAGMRVVGYAGLTPADQLAGPGVTVCGDMRAVLAAVRGRPAT